MSGPGDGSGPATDGPHLTVYADYVCPFCRLGNATLGRYLDDRAERGLPPAEVLWEPFDLRADERRPDGTVPPGASEHKEEYVRSRWSEVEALAEEYDVAMRMDVDRYLRIDARNAQVVALGVQRDLPGLFRPFHDAVYDALWTETRDVGDPAALRSIAEGAGVDPGRVDEYLGDPDLYERFETAARRAAREGIRGVPTLVHDGKPVSGSRSVEEYRTLIEGQ
ncbi:disulfide bond formation protein DsbA [Halobacteriales archaeon QS_8_69_26]|nr:MAG: disulfide bond formation protein DsbA [Halobacteriales archaeon QS_8_69_26]